MKFFHELETERLRLRKISQDDTKDFFELFSDSEVTRFYNFDTLKELSQAEKMVLSSLKEYESMTALRWVITLKDADRLIGTCGFFDLDYENLSAGFGYDLKRKFWGQGIMSEAAGAILDFIYSKRSPILINRIQATTDLDSVASINVLKKLGFAEEGVLRQWGYWKEKFHDVRCFSLIRADFLARKNENN